jgi:hypothetical protein
VSAGERFEWPVFSEPKRIIIRFIEIGLLAAFGYPASPCSEEPSAEGLHPSLNSVISLSDARGFSAISHLRDWFANLMPIVPLGALEQGIEETLGRSLDIWVRGSFFENHVTTFKGRPIIWHVHSGNNNEKDVIPACECFIYYRHLHVNPITTLKVEHAGAKRTSFESEFRTLGVLTELTDEQATRRERLNEWIQELKEFQETLEGIEAGGFATQELRRYAIVDALHSLTRRWLGRLRDQVRKGVLRCLTWVAASDRVCLL